MKGTKRLLLVVAVVLGLALASVGIAYAITGGQPDGSGHPYVGLVVFDDADGPAWRCSGTLLSPTVFLTAGHCTEGAVAARVWFEPDVTGNPDYPKGGASSVEAVRIYTHPKYRWGPTSNPHDMGVVILGPGVTVSEFATLPSEGLLDQLRAEGKLRQGRERAKFTVVGYGTTLSWPPPVISDTYQRQVAESEYLKLLKAWLLMSQNQAPGRDDGGTCYGDSGGPAFYSDSETPETLVGITSWGDTVCVATGFDYRVDIPETLSFICEYGGVGDCSD